LREFLLPKSFAAANRAGEAIIQSVKLLGHQPYIGRPVEDMSDEYRDWLVDFGGSGYVVRYRYDGDGLVTVLAIRHQKEAGF
jgi:plasmid stabilization system protein ParE